MAGSGEIYAEVNASVVNNGIMTLATSGEIGEEGDAGTVVNRCRIYGQELVLG